MTKIREITREDAQEVLEKGSYGVLSTVTPHQEPYGVPINYRYIPEENCLIFHCAKGGKKLDNIHANPLVSFLVVGEQRVIPDRFITHYESVIVTGTAELVKDEKEKVARLLQLCEKYSPNESRTQEVIDHYLSAVAIVKIHIQSIMGKRNRDE